MSELEKQAKTPYQVWNSSRTHSEPLWIQLEDVKKASLEWEAAYDHAAQTANTLCLQILEANKIIDDAPRDLGLEGEKFLSRLRAALNIEQGKKP